MADEQNVPVPQEPQSLELVKLKEDLAEKYGLPSPFKTNLLKNLAKDLTDSGIVPACFRGKSPAVFLAMMRGVELGLAPVQSVMDAFWLSPHGNLGLYSNVKLEILHTRGITTKFLQEDKDGCEILFTPPRESNHEPYTAKFLFEEAVAAQLVKKDSNWEKWRVDMNVARAVGRGWKRLSGIVGSGANILSPEEIQEIEYQTSSPATDSTPEVQTPKEEPAKASRRPKNQTITVQPEVVTTEAKPADPPKPEPSPEPTPAPTAAKQKYYVISSINELPPLDKVEQAPIERLKIATLVSDDLPASMKESDRLAKEFSTSHYILTFNSEGKASILHTSKVPEAKRKYLVVSATVVQTATTAEEVGKAATNPPHEDLSTCSLIAQQFANDKKERYVVIFKNDKGKYEQAHIADPPSAESKPADKPAADEKEKRDELRKQWQALTALAKSRKPVDLYLMAYLGISDIKDFSSDLTKAGRALAACEKDLTANRDSFAANATALGKAAREREEVPVENGHAGELAAMQSYYAARGWNGKTTSLAESWRRANVMSPEKFASAMKHSCVENCSDKDALAFFAVANHYSKEASGLFAVQFAPEEYATRLREIRDENEGAEIEKIPEAKFTEWIERITTPDELPV